MTIFEEKQSVILKFHKKIQKAYHQAGVALLMVMSSISIMAFLLADLTYETQLNQLRVYNLQDKLQAQLNAEARA